MLDSDTKRKIDSLRDILVGKIPNPQSQVEQITTGLIYKFMDDMDQEAAELGGERSFFTGEYEKYAWNNLFDSKLGGEEKVKLYSEAVENMYLNPTAPQLFREIFKNAFLPFKDPSTLNMFLKEIDEFHYSHSEKLGDAFEYLLSFMGSQGDAGQFRTPRHIIDFIVEIVNPQKHESVLDPSCGTAGFLISSYKHILKTNTDKRLGDKLSSEDRKKVGDNLSGYDISPEMIRLSLVNMYLHGFQTPKIEEYDTLSSEDKWNNYCDVILANPPFFSPRGGIQPHNRFGVSSKKAEVLFTSYILDHLKPDGRAGVIVPEGIIFQKGKAYIELRKQLIENGLIAVISLPAGVFNPYSGVKTSVLIINKKLSKIRKELLFINIENDGFALTSSRKEIEGSQIKTAIDSFNRYILGKNDFDIGFLIDKLQISKTDFNLDQKNYVQEKGSSIFGIEKLSSVITESKTKYSGEKENIFSVSNEKGLINSEDIFENRIASKDIKNYKKVSRGYFAYNPSRINVGSIAYLEKDYVGFVSPMYVVFDTNQEKIKKEYLLRLLKSKKGTEIIEKNSTGTVRRTLKFSDLSNISIPLPPLEVQQEIVDELEGYQKIIDGCKQVVENYKPTIDIDPSWEMVELEKVCEIKSGSTPSRKNNDYWSGDINWYSSGELNNFFAEKPLEKITKKGLKNSSCSIFPNGSLMIGMYDTAAFKMSILKEDAAFNQAICAIKPNDKINLEFLYYFFLTNKEKYLNSRQGVRQKNLSKGFIAQIEVPKISLDLQNKILELSEEERKVIDGNKRLIEIYTQKIQERINKVWGEG